MAGSAAATQESRKRDSRVISSSGWNLQFPDESRLAQFQLAANAGSPFGSHDGFEQYVSPAALFNAGSSSHQDRSPARQRQLSSSPSKSQLRQARSKTSLQQKRSSARILLGTSTSTANSSSPAKAAAVVIDDPKPVHKRSRTDMRAARNDAEPPPLPAHTRHRQSLSVDQQQLSQYFNGASMQPVENAAGGGSWQAQLSAMSASSNDNTATVVAAAATKMIVNLSQQAGSSGVGSSATSTAVANVADALKAANNAPLEEADGLPPRSIFNITHSSHLSTISLRRDKTLTTFIMYDAALWYLLSHVGRHDLAAKIGDSSQGERSRETFRRWCLKSFELIDRERIEKWKPLDSMKPELKDMLFNNASEGKYAVVSTYTGKGIIPPTSAYDLLTRCHRQTRHGGRDKTHGSLKHHCANVSKELVQAFIKICPTCSARRKKDEASPDDAVSEGADATLDEGEEEDGDEDSSEDEGDLTLDPNLEPISLPQIVMPDSAGPAPLAFTADQQAFLASLRAQGYALTRLEHSEVPASQKPRQESAAMLRGVSAMSQGSSTTSGATASTDGPVTPTFDPAEANAFAWMDPNHGILHSAPRLTPTTSAASTNGSITAKALDLPLDANAETLRRYLQAAEAGCTVTAVQDNNSFAWNDRQDVSVDGSGKKQRAPKPPPLNLSMLHATFAQLTGSSSQGSASIASCSSINTGGLNSASSASTAVSEPVLQPRVALHLPGLTIPSRVEASASAPPTQTEFNVSSQKPHTAMYMEKRNVNSPRASPSSHKATPLSSIPQSQLSSFGPTYGAVFGNAGLGGRGNLFDEEPMLHQTVYGAPDVRVYLDPSYGIPPEGHASHAPDQASQRQRSNTQLFESFDPSIIDLNKPDLLLRRHSHSGQHDPVRLAGGVVASSSGSDVDDGDSGGEASSTGSVIVYDLSGSESDSDSADSKRVAPVSVTTPMRAGGDGHAEWHREQPTQPSPLERTAKKLSTQKSKGNLLFPLDMGSPARLQQQAYVSGQLNNIDYEHGHFDRDTSSNTDLPLSSFRKLSLASPFALHTHDQLPSADNDHTGNDAYDFNRFDISSSSFEEYLNSCVTSAPVT
ncbi:hypothetical protein K437DRAFT_191269 [Tilletiaria anomala UBC 951]|uniref:Integrase zinc-binding domain-containing protein n=1 Tax=Tilletiaria anomala (strain ATCC 24038 / CBS 436.72 / UBC 951) TaxID=1037660 RepID=A0A066VIY5_TILAU|nr:uncharacterized protein K437DRAFT_191269 [Tilletiaria anomala UBC 951]KDN40258.1 hypothetical protein K437DRAFT_191269 [Tilletiaria anomala UBC 951]